MTTTLLRTRDKDQPDETSTLYKYYSSGGDPSLVASSQCKVHSHLERMTDYVTPGWRRLISDGKILMFPCVYQLTTSSCGGGSYDAVDANGGRYFTQGGSITFYQLYAGNVRPLTHSLDFKDLYRDATSRCLAQVDNTPYDFAEDLLELKQTLRFIRSVLDRITKLCINFFDALRSLRDVLNPRGMADAYLEFRFALSPLVRSIYRALDALQKGSKQPSIRRTSRASAKSTAEVSDVARQYWSGSVYDSFHRAISANAECRAIILYEVTNPVRDWRHTLGLRDKDLLVGLWKTARLSFLVDRLFNVSTLLRGLLNLADPKVHLLSACVTYRYKTVTNTVFVEQVNPGWIVTVQGDTLTLSDGGYRRDVWVPTLIDIIPAVHWGNLVKDVTSTLDLLAIAIQWFGKLR